MRDFKSEVIKFKIGLCGCFGNLSSSIITYVIPCVPYATNAAETDVCGFVPAMICFFIPFAGQYYGAKSRQGARERSGIDGSLLCDCLVFSACPCCVIVQTQTELGVNMGEDMGRI